MERPLESSPYPRWKLLLAAWGAFAVSLFLPCLKVNRPESDLEARPLAGSASGRAAMALSGADCVGYTFRFLKALFVDDDFSYEMELVLKSGKKATESASNSYRAKVEIYYAMFAPANAALVISPAILALAPRRSAVLRKLRAPLWASALLVVSFFPHALIMTHFAIRAGALLWLAAFALLAWGVERALRDLRSLEAVPTRP